MQKLDVAAAFLYTGVDGPFLPYNPLAFPLDCNAEYTMSEGITNTSDPTAFNFTGQWGDNDCTTGASQIMSLGPSGMGGLYTDGTHKPMATAQQIWSKYAGKVGGWIDCYAWCAWCLRIPSPPEPATLIPPNSIVPHQFALPVVYKNFTLGSDKTIIAASNGITAVLADDGRTCIEAARKRKAAARRAQRRRELQSKGEKGDGKQKDKEGKGEENGKGKGKDEEGPRQLVNIM